MNGDGAARLRSAAVAAVRTAGITGPAAVTARPTAAVARSLDIWALAAPAGEHAAHQHGDDEQAAEQGRTGQDRRQQFVQGALP